MLVVPCESKRTSQISGKLTDADRSLTVKTADIDVSMRTARSKGIIRKLYVSIPNLLLFRRKLEIEWVIS